MEIPISPPFFARGAVAAADRPCFSEGASSLEPDSVATQRLRERHETAESRGGSDHRHPTVYDPSDLGWQPNDTKRSFASSGRRVQHKSGGEPGGGCDSSLNSPATRHPGSPRSRRRVAEFVASSSPYGQPIVDDGSQAECGRDHSQMRHFAASDPHQPKP